MDRDHGRARGHDGITPGNPDLTRHTPEQVRNRLILMAAISIALLSVFPFIQDSSYRGSPDSHATMQMIGACFGILAGLVLMVHFYSFGERLYLFMGLAFLINGIGDFFHGLVSYQYVREWTGLTDSTLDQFIPASFATGRILFGILLLLGPISERTSSRSPDPGRETIRAVVIFLTVLAVLLTVILTVSLPGLIHPDRAITRPMDLASAMILIAALAVYVKNIGQLTLDHHGISVLIDGAVMSTLSSSVLGDTSEYWIPATVIQMEITIDLTPGDHQLKVITENGVSNTMQFRL